MSAADVSDDFVAGRHLNLRHRSHFCYTQTWVNYCTEKTSIQLHLLERSAYHNSTNCISRNQT